MKVQDDRTDEQRETHPCLVVGTDSFLSGWGGAEGGASVAAWACSPDDLQTVERWVRNRSDMKRVRVVYDGPNCKTRYKPKRAAHFHVYVVTDNHPARGQK